MNWVIRSRGAVPCLDDPLTLSLSPAHLTRDAFPAGGRAALDRYCASRDTEWLLVVLISGEARENDGVCPLPL
jgi:hypothetical protein